MKVVLLFNLNRGHHEHEAEFDIPITIDALRQALDKEHVVTTIEATRDVSAWVAHMMSDPPDLVFNVAEGFSGPARESFYAALLEQLGVKYCGPGPTELLICQNKALTKQLLANSSVPVLWSALLTQPRDLDAAGGVAARLPIIVKLNAEGSSLGLDENCIARNYDALQRQVSRVWEKFRANILIESYVEGRDISMSYVEGLGVLGPVEYRYPMGSVYDFALKTKVNDAVDIVVPEDLEESVRVRLKQSSEVIVGILDPQGYVRIDFRLAPGGDIALLEINGQVSFHPNGAFVLAAQTGGVGFDELVLHIVRHASMNRRRASAIGRNYSSSMRV